MTIRPEVGDLYGGRYRVVEKIGEGGMQFVVRATDEIIGRDVALKTPKNTSAERRFRRSAEVSARINHPNVAKTLDFFEEDDTEFLVEELIEGNDFDIALLQVYEIIDPFLVARIFHHMAKGLAASHHAGVVHRDLKPTNVMITGGLGMETVKITDFGIAKMADEELAEAAEGGTETITTSQTAVGALPYMSPEAINTPREVNPPTDIWSLGAMMFQLVTGTQPFGQGLRAVTAITSGNLAEVPTAITSNPQFSTLVNEIIDIICQCLNLDQDARPTADEIVDLCSQLCYPISTRYKGTVKTIYHGSYGFVRVGFEDVFFHMDSVYGNRPSSGDMVAFSKFDGGGAMRAHPVVKLKQPRRSR
jgi:eukaryotic-like serine/threonine-protein kinase